MTGKLPINIDHLLRQRSIEGGRELLSLAATVSFDDRYCQTASLDDLSHRLIQEFLRDIGSDLAPQAADLSIADLGQRLNIVGGPPEAMFPQAPAQTQS